MRRAALVLLLGVAGRCWAEEEGAGESTKQWPTNEDTLPEKDDEGARSSASAAHARRSAPSPLLINGRGGCADDLDIEEVDQNEMDPMKWADKVSKKQYKKKPKEEREVDPDTGLPKADVHAHRTLKPEDLSYDFLAKMGFVPPPPPPPWGFNKEGDSTAEIEERVMRQLIPIADLPTTMMCDACGAISLQLVNKLKKADRINEKRFRVGKKLGEYELLAALDEMCEGKFAIDRDAEGEVPPADWDEYGVADLNETCASPPVISCWNSTKRLVGPGCAKAYEFRREKEERFGWLTTRIKPQCEGLISEYGVRSPSAMPRRPACIV